QFEFIIRSVIDHRNSQTSESHIDRSYMLVSRLNHSFRLDIIGGGSNHHAGNASHKSEVLAALMRRAVLANGNSAVSRADLHVQFRITHRVAHLLKSAACGKH